MQDSNQKKIYELLPDLTDQHSISCQMDESHGYVLKHEDCIWQVIELPDVLRAIEKKYSDDRFATVASNGWLHFGVHRGFWNLTKPYEGQSDEFKAFLKSILGV